MSFNQGYSAYQKTNVTTASQGHLIVLLYEAAVKNLKNASACIDENNSIKACDIEKFSNFIQKTQSIISELQASLDIEKGGDIAKNLMSLYFFFNNELFDAHLKHSKSKIENIQKMIEELLSAWKVIEADTTAQEKIQPARTTVNIEG